MIQLFHSVTCKIQFLYLAHQTRYTEALALTRFEENRNSVNDFIWANYQLCLYQTVLQHQWDRKNIKSGVAIAVSKAACGQYCDAKDIIYCLKKLPDFNKYQVDLVSAIAPFMPDVALSLLIESNNIPSSLLIALLLKNGEKEEALRCISQKLCSPSLRNESELQLLLSNATSNSPVEKVSYLNKFLEHFNLPSLTLRDKSKSLSIINLTCDSHLPKVSGPLVTVLMTAYNIEDRIGYALDSLLKQSYSNIEIIVIDDASSDLTETVIKNIAKTDSRIRYIRLPINSGTFVAKQVGLKFAQGEFVTCQDSDDWSHPLKIELQIQPLLASTALVATTSNWVRVQDDGIFYARQIYPLLRLNPASPMFRREIVMSKVGVWDSVRTGADSEFLARLKLVFGKKAVASIKLPLTFGSHRQNSLMTASDTGHDDHKISPIRLAYWEAWHQWHMTELRRKNLPVVQSLNKKYVRKFDVPKEIKVQDNVLEKIYSTFF